METNSGGMATVFQSSGFNAEVEADMILGVLETNGMSAVISGLDTLPGAHEVLVQVPAEQQAQAEALIAEAKLAGPAAAEEAEKAGEEL